MATFNDPVTITTPIEFSVAFPLLGLAFPGTAQQRERDAKLDMQPWGGKFSSGERKRIAAGALASGFKDQTEYLFSLVMRDTK